MKNGTHNIRKLVIIGHIGLIAVIWGAAKLADWFTVDVEEEITPVTVLSGAPENDASGEEAATPNETETEQTEPEEPEPKQEEPQEDTPEEVDMPETPAEETTSNAPRQQTEKPAWKARSAEEIRRQAKLDPAPAQKRTDTNEQTSRPRIDASRFSRRLEEELRNIQKQSSGANTRNTGGSLEGRYAQAIGQYLKERWQQPSRHTLKGSVSAPVVRLVIKRDGTVREARLVQTTGNTSMDGSVRRLLNRLDKLPALSKYGISEQSMTLRVKFELDD